MVNKVSERFPETSVRVITETPRSVLVIVNPGDGDQITHLKLDFDGLVEAQRVYGVL
ncbi:putative olfactory receptor-like protein [Escherichia phage HY03]|uniref:Putative olfactory receptor-like protein n=1 Tax=Escherichia phage HY03 TaxID=1654926 RepID=A0A162E390_9CAUD|nr:putative olfactory receptor-like protein [Escherichia phage HY03]AKJ72915.1 putative olfactory receptor-like protein [Escherichia phage HY03]